MKPKWGKELLRLRDGTLNCRLPFMKWVIDRDLGWNRIRGAVSAAASRKLPCRVGVSTTGKAVPDRGASQTGCLPFDGVQNRIDSGAKLDRSHLRSKAATKYSPTWRGCRGISWTEDLSVDKALNVLGAKYSAAVKNTVTQRRADPATNAPVRSRASWQRLRGLGKRSADADSIPDGLWVRDVGCIGGAMSYADSITSLANATLTVTTAAGGAC